MAAEDLCPTNHTFTQWLSGWDTDSAVPWDFQVTGGMKANQPGKIPVPSCWELQGYGTYAYGQDKITHPNEKGLYGHTFTVPADWKGRPVFLVFDGVMTDVAVKVNGQSAGPVHQGSFYRFKYDVTRLVKFGGENRLEAEVSKESANESVNRAERRGDYWTYGGIFRPVWLMAPPAEYIEDFALDAKADGAFALKVTLGNTAKADAVSVTILDAKHEPVGKEIQTKILAGQKDVSLKTKVENPRTWTAETPNRYTVSIELQAAGKPLHTVERRFGFRTVEVKANDGIYVNGRKVKLKGACRHSFYPDTGRAVSFAVCEQDVKLLKELNMNAVRMSHYPPDEYFLELCDREGLYVLDELGGWQKCYDADIGAKLVEEMVLRDRNHPSIVFWDNGNEGGWNTALDGEFAKYDLQARPVLHPWEYMSGVQTKHYTTYAQTESLLASNYVFMPTEFLHGLYDGGLGAGFEDYWNLMVKSPTAAGGFFWALVDEAVKRTDQNGWLDSHTNYAPDGILGPHREKEGSFYTIKQLWSPVYITLRELPANFDGTIPVQNLYDFTDLSTCRFAWEFVKFPGPLDQAAAHTVVGKGEFTGPSLAPHASGSVRLALPANWKQADALRLTARNAKGEELYTWVWAIAKTADLCQRAVPKATGKASGTAGAETIQVQGGKLALEFSAKNGLLQKVTRGGKPFSLRGGPLLVADNVPDAKKKSSKGSKTKTPTPEPTTLSAPPSAPRQVTGKQAGDEYVVRAEYAGPMKFVEWRVRGDGWVVLNYAYDLSGEFDYFGVSFNYPEAQVKGVKWLGDGPYRVWKNRRAGVTLDVWHKNYNDTLAGQSWEYPEFKGYHAGLRWAVLETSEGPITVVTGQDDLFLRLFTPKPPLEPRTARMLFPSGDISFLHGIAPIGNKFHTPAETGPMGEKNKASGTYQASLYLYFGEP